MPESPLDRGSHTENGAGAGGGTSRLRLVAHDDATVIHVEGPVDAVVGVLLREAVEAAVATTSESRTVEIDLGEAEWCSSAGVGALAACAQAGARVRGGIRFRVGTASR